MCHTENVGSDDFSPPLSFVLALSVMEEGSCVLIVKFALALLIQRILIQ